MQITARELASLVNGEIVGNPDVLLERPCRIEEGTPGSVTFLGNPKYEEFIYTTKASAVLVPRDFEPRAPLTCTLLKVDNVYAAVAMLLNQFNRGDFLPQGIAEQVFIHPEAELGEGVSVGPFAVIEAGAKIGAGSSIGAQVFVGKDVSIGEEVKIFPGARILHDCQIGNKCLIQCNAVIGSDGFGYALGDDNNYKRIPQLGNVVLEDEVDIGSCSTIDRASIGSTIIRRGAKIDNLVQVAHNASIGNNTVVAAQSGIAGSSKIGSGVQLGGQSGVAGHIQVADGVRVQAQSGIASHIKDSGQALYGSPAIPYHDYLRSYSVFKKLPDLIKRIEDLEKQIELLTSRAK